MTHASQRLLWPSCLGGGDIHSVSGFHRAGGFESVRYRSGFVDRAGSRAPSHRKLLSLIRAQKCRSARFGNVFVIAPDRVIRGGLSELACVLVNWRRTRGADPGQLQIGRSRSRFVDRSGVISGCMCQRSWYPRPSAVGNVSRTLRGCRVAEVEAQLLCYPWRAEHPVRSIHAASSS